ncbi:MAG: hypothetical protein V2A73_08280 [Pseudomonadota bacterium]
MGERDAEDPTLRHDDRTTPCDSACCEVDSGYEQKRQHAHGQVPSQRAPLPTELREREATHSPENEPRRDHKLGQRQQE